MLRHTHATLLLQAGISPKVVSERLGHATVAFTMQVYAHAIPGMQADAATAFSDLATGLYASNLILAALHRCARIGRGVEIQIPMFETMTQIALLLEGALKGVGPGVALGEDTKLLKRIMDQTAARVGKELQGQPDLEAEFCNIIGEVYRALGRFEEAEVMHRRARALQEKEPPGARPRWRRR